MNILVCLHPVCAAAEIIKGRSEKKEEEKVLFQLPPKSEDSERRNHEEDVCVFPTKKLTGVDAGAGGRDAKLRLDELWDEGDERGDYGALCRVGQADEQEGHVAEDPHCCFGQI